MGTAGKFVSIYVYAESLQAPCSIVLYPAHHGPKKKRLLYVDAEMLLQLATICDCTPLHHPRNHVRYIIAERARREKTGREREERACPQFISV